MLTHGSFYVFSSSIFLKVGNKKVAVGVSGCQSRLIHHRCINSLIFQRCLFPFSLVENEAQVLLQWKHGLIQLLSTLQVERLLIEFWVQVWHWVFPALVTSLTFNKTASFQGLHCASWSFIICYLQYFAMLEWKSITKFPRHLLDL